MATLNDSLLIRADESQFLIVNDADAPLNVRGANNSLIQPGVDGQSIVVITGAQWGNVQVTVQRHDQGAPTTESGHWDEVAEVEVDSADGLSLSTLDGDSPIQITDLSGPLVVRVSAAGRADGEAKDYDELCSEDGPSVVEHYLIETWPKNARD